MENEIISFKGLSDKQIDKILLRELAQDLKEIGELGHERKNLVSDCKTNH
jgi:hypothetical protein